MTRFWRSGGSAAPDNVAERAWVQLRVLDVAMVERLTLAALQSYGADPRVGMHLRTEAGRDEWEVRGIGFVPAEAAEAGRWALSLAPVGHDRALRVGEHLVAA